jgi:hypothetical protein
MTGEVKLGSAKSVPGDPEFGGLVSGPFISNANKIDPSVQFCE